VPQKEKPESAVSHTQKREGGGGRSGAAAQKKERAVHRRKTAPVERGKRKRGKTPALARDHHERALLRKEAALEGGKKGVDYEGRRRVENSRQKNVPQLTNVPANQSPHYPWKNASRVSSAEGRPDAPAAKRDRKFLRPKDVHTSRAELKEARLSLQRSG